MKMKKKSLIKMVGSFQVLATALLIEKGLQKIERRLHDFNDTEKTTNRKLTALSIIYHAIGIFYNE
jgi:hypothetical protein